MRASAADGTIRKKIAGYPEAQLTIRRGDHAPYDSHCDGRITFSFASALSDIGLPRGDIPIALFSFNVRVELGQIAFIAAVLGTIALAKRLKLNASIERYALRGAPFGIGALAAFWFFDRLAGFLN